MKPALSSIASNLGSRSSEVTPSLLGRHQGRAVYLALVVALSMSACASSDRASDETLATKRDALRLDEEQFVVDPPTATSLALVTSGQSIPIVVAQEDYPGVLRVAADLQADVARVTQVKPELRIGELPSAGNCVVLGTLGKSPFIDQLVAEGKLDVAAIGGRWEASLIQVVDQPWAGVDRALVIAGSDKRGTIYGSYDLSAQIGVSPWYYWADVPVAQRNALHVLPLRRVLGSPAVKYRGIFINDEQPALEAWANKEFGGFNTKFYAKLFELMLRLRANYLWPAMWGKAFALGDTKNPELADDFGIVMGTSHHEPLMRNQEEWKRAGLGAWNFTTNQANLTTFWAEGIRRMGERESIVTIGMRGDGDTSLSPNPDVPLLQSVIAAQRQILADASGRDPTQIPQVWTIYKEVQDYYEQGLRAPDDVTVMIADDNFGNIRKLPLQGEPIPSGGFGIYYHFDYVGSPRNYKWLNTNPLPRIWEQMHLAYDSGIDRIWLVNVGDLKLLEFPTQFFLDYAWDPRSIPAERLKDYTTAFAARQFGSEHATAIGEILARYAKYNARRKPELLAPETYSLVNYREAERVVADYYDLAKRADALYQALPAQYRDAFFQLVQFPVMACANLNDLYVSVARNRLYAKQGRAATNAMADRATALFAKDAELSRYYNLTLANGKWNHIADQTHIGYKTWQEPSANTLPELKRLNVSEAASMAIAVEGSESSWPGDSGVATLPEFHPYLMQPAQYFELFNRGTTPFEFQIEPGAAYVSVAPAQGTVTSAERVWVSVDWANAPSGMTRVPITVRGPDATSIVLEAPVNHLDTTSVSATARVEQQGYVVMDADQFNRKVELDPIRWQVIDDIGRTGSGVTAFPVTTPPQTPGGTSPHLEYDVHLWKSGQVRVRVSASPTMQVVKTGLKYAASFDDQAPKNVNIHADTSDSMWQERVSNNINSSFSNHSVTEAGPHVLKIWMIDPGIVLQKVVVEVVPPRPSYLGPPSARFEEPAIPELSAVPAVSGLAVPASAGTGSGGAASTSQAGTAQAGTAQAAGASTRGPRKPTKTSAGLELSGGGCRLAPSTLQQSGWLAAGLLSLLGLRYRRRRGMKAQHLSK